MQRNNCSKRRYTAQRAKEFEKLYLRVTKLKLDVGYFDKCLEMNLVPYFLKLKPPDLEVYKHQDYYLRIVSDQKKLIINQQVKT